MLFNKIAQQKNLQLPKAKIEISLKNKENYTTIILQSNIFAKNIKLISNLDGNFSDNFFDLFPNSKKEIKFYKKNENLKIKYKCLNNL